MKTVLIGALALMTMSAAASAAAPAAGDEANPAYMWDLSELYPSPQAWTASYEKTKAEADKLEQYKGTLGKSAQAMLAALDAISAVHKESDRLYVYASLKGDEDVRVAADQERVQLGQALGTRLAEKTAWLSTEILQAGGKKVHEFEKQSPELAHRFDLFLDNTLRAAPHTLSPESEGVMAAASSVLVQPGNIYSQLSNGELPFPSLTLSDGTRIERLDQAAYTKYRQLPNRADRKLVFDTFWGAWKKYEAPSARR